MEFQKVALKILSDAPATLNLDPFLAIFGRWRKDASHPAQWVDLADYAHMPRGPGVVLIGHRCNFSFDMGTAAPGVLYVSKKGLDGGPVDRLRVVFRDCLHLTRSLLAESEFPQRVRLQTGSLELAFNDRLQTPNDDETDRQLRPAVEFVLDHLFGPGACRITREPDPGRRYGFRIEVPSPPPLDVLAARVER
jgi:hypothetical protein